MTRVISAIEEIASGYDAIIFDQWGVLHDGSSPYVGAIAAIDALAQLPVKLGVLSNSGKRAAPNRDRIGAMGFDMDAFDHVMTSGEALWRDIERGAIPAKRLFPVERTKGDADAWAEGLDITLVRDVRKADAILMMGLPDDAKLDLWAPRLKGWHTRKMPMYCSNPDRQSPRADGLVVSPGALAHAYQSIGGETAFYGKPHLPVFRALEQVFGQGRYLMVGDSLEHDIAGAQTAGWDSLLVEGGLYAGAFAAGDGPATLAELTTKQSLKPPTYRIKEVC